MHGINSTGINDITDVLIVERTGQNKGKQVVKSLFPFLIKPIIKII